VRPEDPAIHGAGDTARGEPGVGVNDRIVRHGANGFLARSTADWAYVLGQLLSDAMLRRRRAARLESASRRSTRQAVHGPRVARVLHEAVRGTARARLRRLEL